MIWLVLAIASSALVSIMMRLGEKHIKSDGAMFVINYAVCLILSRAFMGKINLFTDQPGVSPAIWMGLISGILYLASFVLLKQNIQKNGVVMASVFMKLGVLVPVLMAIFIFRERPGILQIIGIVLAVAAILVVQLEGAKADPAAGKTGSSLSGKLLLILLLIGGGVTDSMSNIYNKVGTTEFKDHYLFYTFLAALLCAVIFLIFELRKKTGRTFAEKIGWGSLMFGVFVGIPNYMSARFLLLALENIPAVITYPMYSVITMLVIGIVGVICFQEKLSRGKIIAIVMVIAALVLLN